MRSRYSAYALGESDYIWRTWHPTTRPERVTPDTRLHWIALEILDAVGDEVEFRARCDGAEGQGVLHERSLFARRAGHWFYLAAT